LLFGPLFEDFRINIKKKCKKGPIPQVLVSLESFSPAHYQKMEEKKEA